MLEARLSKMQEGHDPLEPTLGLISHGLTWATWLGGWCYHDFFAATIYRRRNTLPNHRILVYFLIYRICTFCFLSRFPYRLGFYLYILAFLDLPGAQRYVSSSSPGIGTASMNTPGDGGEPCTPSNMGTGKLFILFDQDR